MGKLQNEISSGIGYLPFFDDRDQRLGQFHTAAMDRPQLFGQLRKAFPVQPGRNDIVIGERLDEIRRDRPQRAEKIIEVEHFDAVNREGGGVQPNNFFFQVFFQ